ncbi:MAG TPA: hypothetical protein VG055_25645 [Planctomycetaceae bacterium]|nr:hypothetical protein [Planctomycetaceae bacterium]
MTGTHKAWLSIGFVATAACYLGLLAAPPRMELHEDDSIFYMSQAHDIFVGRPVGNHQYPTGYAHLLAMAHVDLGRPWYRVVAINLAFLALGLSSAFFLLRGTLQLSQPESAGICLLSLWSWMLVTFSTRQLPEPAFFGLSGSCLLFASLASERERFVPNFATALLLACIAVWVRSVGAALLPVLLFVLVKRIDRRFIHWFVPTICVIALCFGLLFRDRLMPKNYSGGFSATLAHPVSTISQTTLWRIREIGEVGQNASPTAFEPREQSAYEDEGNKITEVPELPIAVRAGSELRALSYVTGTAFLVLMAIGFSRSPKNVVSLYLVAYGFILLLWPFGMSRFLVPLVPFLIAYAWIGLKSLRPPRWVPIVYVIAFCLCGSIAMGNEWFVTINSRDQASRSFDDIVFIFQYRMGIKL